jgi:hypothetical protein
VHTVGAVEATLSAWRLPRSLDVTEITDFALRTLLIPDLQLGVLSSTKASVTVELAKGEAPTDSDAVVFIEGRGPFDVLRRETLASAGMLLVLTPR